MNQTEWLEGQIKNILVATDFEENSFLALRYATSLAKRFHAALATLNVFQFGPHSQTVEALDHVPSRERKNAERQLQAFAAVTEELGVISSQIVVEGTVPAAILETLCRTRANLLVIGTKNFHTGVNHLLVGSNTEALMLASAHLTLTVGPRVVAPTGEAAQFKRVLYITDLTGPSSAAAPLALAFAKALDAELDICHFSATTEGDAPEDTAEQALEYIYSLNQVAPDAPVEWNGPAYHAARTFSEEALMEKVGATSNLIVLGVQPASYLQRHLHSSLAYRLLAAAASPVLTVPSNDFYDHVIAPNDHIDAQHQKAS
jgi:nucleotide-binding universal stress UspA family protein